MRDCRRTWRGAIRLLPDLAWSAAVTAWAAVAVTVASDSRQTAVPLARGPLQSQESTDLCQPSAELRAYLILHAGPVRGIRLAEVLEKSQGQQACCP
jgi:hypothetical protein